MNHASFLCLIFQRDFFSRLLACDVFKQVLIKGVDGSVHIPIFELVGCIGQRGNENDDSHQAIAGHPYFLELYIHIIR